MTQCYIDPRKVFMKLSENPKFLEPIASSFKYDMEGLTYVNHREQFIDQMVICENRSRFNNNCDNLNNNMTVEWNSFSAKNPLDALHLVVHGVHLDFRPSHPQVVTGNLLREFMAVVYALKKTVQMEPRTNYQCTRGTFPVLNQHNIMNARACLIRLSLDMLWVIMALLSNISHIKGNFAQLDLINIIINGDWIDSNEVSVRYSNARSANALNLYHSLPRFANELAMHLMYRLEPNDITSFNLISILLDKCYLLEWKSNSTLESYLHNHDLHNPLHCKAWAKQLDMSLPIGTWGAIPEDRSQEIFTERLNSYLLYFMTNITEYTDFRSKDKNTFVKKALNLHMMSDVDLQRKFANFEFGDKRSVFTDICMRSIQYPSMDFIYVSKGNGKMLDCNKAMLSYKNIDVLFNSYLFDWIRNKISGTKVVLSEILEGYSFEHDNDYYIDELLDNTMAYHEWITTTPYYNAYNSSHATDLPDTFRTTFSPEEMVSLYHILQDTGLFSPVQRHFMMSILQPVMAIDSAKTYQDLYFRMMSQTEQNTIRHVLTTISIISKHLLTWEAGSLWLQPRDICAQNKLEKMQVCRRHLAHYVLKLNEYWSTMDHDCKIFTENLSCYKLCSKAGTFLRDDLLTMAHILSDMTDIRDKILNRVKDATSQSFSPTDEPGDGSLTRVAVPPEINTPELEVASDMDEFVEHLRVTPTVMNITANYLGKFTNTTADMHALIK